MTHIAALVRLAHPLPTLLNALVAAALTTTAGGSASQAALAALTMLGVHTSIGAMNDLLDQAGDAGRAEKPLVGGSVTPR
jgi:4-hydroxybenzoate polyprenyltransferase